MKIGLVTDFYYPWIAGPAALLRSLGWGLAERGHEVTLLAPSADGPTGVEMDGPVRVTRARTLRSPVGHELRVALPLGSDVRRWLDREAPDVVHVHHPFPLSARAVLGARRRGIPVAATNHTIPSCSLWGIRNAGPMYAAASGAFGRWIVWLLSRCDAVATPTETAAEELRRMGWNRPVEVISNGIDTERFQPGPPDESLRARLGLDDRPIILYTGRLDAEKQMDVWMDAVHTAAGGRDLQFVVGGNGSERARLERRVQELGLESHVRFTGYLADAEFPALYRLADLYFITSPVELQSISTLEALASGLPAVGVRAGALPELIVDGVTGATVPPGDSAAAARALAGFIDDAEKRDRLGRAGRDLVMRRHGLSGTIERYECFLANTARMRRGLTGSERAVARG